MFFDLVHLPKYVYSHLRKLLIFIPIKCWHLICYKLAKSNHYPQLWRKLMIKTIRNISLVTAAVMSTSAFSNVHMDNVNINTDQCDITLNYDLTISPDHILIIEDDETMIDIYNDKMLFIKGEKIDLSPEQQTMVSNYANSLRSTIPEVSGIAVEAIGIAYEGINAAFGDHIDTESTREKFDELESRITEKYNSQNGHYNFSQGNFNTNINDDEVDVLVQDLIQDIVPQLIGGIMANVSKAMMSGDADFSEFDNIGDRVDQEIEARADELEERAEAFCYSLKEVDELEHDLVASNTKFIYFDLLNLKQN